jgi:hypothetical protein
MAGTLLIRQISTGARSGEWERHESEPPNYCPEKWHSEILFLEKRCHRNCMHIFYPVNQRWRFTHFSATIWTSILRQRNERTVLLQPPKWASTVILQRYVSDYILHKIYTIQTDLPRALSLGVKQPGRDADHSPPSGAEVKEGVELYLHSPIRFHGVVLSQSTGTTLPLPPTYV